ncbi:MAG: hypothetical protein ABW185_11475 [Sedimenticola sp.]
MEDTGDITELTPVVMDDNTEVKVAYNVRSVKMEHAASMNGGEYTDSVEYGENENEHENEQDDTLSNTNNDSLYQVRNDLRSDDSLNQLLNLFRNLPAEMFHNRVLQNFASCDASLEGTRSSIFDSIKENSDYPFGLQTELKRRVFTRYGDSVAYKLAKDIHVLLSIVDGGSYTDMKEMLSAGRKPRARTGSTNMDHSVIIQDAVQTTEYKELQQIVINLKADMLRMKQTYNANEIARSEQVKI